MINENNNSKLKAIIIALSLLLAGSLFYIFKLTTNVKETTVLLNTTKTEKELVLADLETLKSKYDDAIAENTSVSDDLVAEREKVVKLLADVKKSNGDLNELSKYKKMFLQLDTKMKTLIKENGELKTSNQKLTTQIDSTNTILNDARTVNSELTNQNEALETTVSKAAKLKIYNLKTLAYKVKSSGKKIETDKASRADMLKISFTIAENEVAKTGDKTYKVQVVDSKNNVLGSKKTETFGEKILTYSFATTVKYENKSVNVTENLPGEDFAKGEYYVRIYDNDILVSSTQFSLR